MGSGRRPGECPRPGVVLWGAPSICSLWRRDGLRTPGFLGLPGGSAGKNLPAVQQQLLMFFYYVFNISVFSVQDLVAACGIYFHSQGRNLHHFPGSAES